MNQVPNIRGPMGLKHKPTPAEISLGREHMGWVAKIPCVICKCWPVEVHHVIHDRFSQARASDFDTIPLCPDHHRELHAGKATWRKKHGADYEYLPWVREEVERLREAEILGDVF